MAGFNDLIQMAKLVQKRERQAMAGRLGASDSYSPFTFEFKKIVLSLSVSLAPSRYVCGHTNLCVI